MGVNHLARSLSDVCRVPIFVLSPPGFVFVEGFDGAVAPSTPCGFKMALTSRVLVNAAGLESVRFGVGWCLVCSTSVFVLGLIGVSVVLVLVFVRSVRGNHHMILEVANSLDNLGRLLSFFLIVCL